MRLLGVLLAFGLVLSVCGKNSVKATESMGQEIIEIGPPVKGLPPDIDEEPSAEVDDDDKPVSVATTTPPPKTKDSKKTTTLGTKPDTRRKGSEPVIDGDEDDAKIEKELSEIYKDNADYKEDKENDTSSKPIGRAGEDSFQLEPKNMGAKEVEKFRTSMDPYKCKGAKLLSEDVKNGKGLKNENEQDHSMKVATPNNSHSLNVNSLLLSMTLMFTVLLIT